MAQQLYEHIQKFTDVTEQDFPEILSHFKPLQVEKKQIIVRAGEKCNCNYFVLSGCLHMYFESGRGTDHTVQFGIENWWITDSLAFHHQRKTDFYIQAVEPSAILSIDYNAQQALFEKFPCMEKYFRAIYEIAYGAALMRFKYIFDYSKEEIFFRFRDAFPEFVQRVPQYLVATYLGLTPEYLSEIKSKKLS